MTYTKLIEDLKEFKNKSWDGMPEENIDAAIVIIDKMHRLHKIISQSNLKTNLTKDDVHEQLIHTSIDALAAESWQLYSTIIDMRNIIMEEDDDK